MFEDRLLIWRLKSGSEDALRRIYEKYGGDLLTLAANLLADAGAAEDVVQDVFTGFVQSVEQFELRGSLKGYLATCVANRARDCLRKKQRQRMVGADEAEQVACDAAGPVQLIIRNEQLERLSCALAGIPYEQKEVIVLHLQGEMKFKTIAQLQQASIKTVQSRYRYGLDKLRSILDGEVEK